MDMMHWIEDRGIETGIFPALRAVSPALRVWFTSRRGGKSRPPFDSLNLGIGTGDVRSDVMGNRRLVADILGLDRRRIARGDQVHGTAIATVERGGVSPGTDGLITAKRGLALAINTADCFPVVLHSPPEMVLCAVHAGREGAAGRILSGAVAALAEDFGADPGHIVAACGPGICAGCYEVSAGEARRFPGEAVRKRGEAYFLDLRAALRRDALEAGVRKANWFEAGECTSCDPSRFYSYRRDRGRTGRHWTVALMV